MSNQDDEFKNKNRQALEESSITPHGNLVLKSLNIDPVAIKDIKPPWKRNKYRAVVNWLTKYKTSPDVSNLEKVKGYLEALHHLCELKVWEEAGKIIMVCLNTPTNEELHNQLDTWGYHSEQIELYKKLLNQVNPSFDAILLNGLGNAYYVLGR